MTSLSYLTDNHLSNDYLFEQMQTLVFGKLLTEGNILADG